jgi:hypothetical protein
VTTKTKTTALLERARARLADPYRWTRHKLARDAEGREIAPGMPGAVRWCAVGALYAEQPYRYRGDGLRGAIRRLARAVGGTRLTDVYGVNDGTAGKAGTHAAVLAIFDEAIRQK